MPDLLFGEAAGATAFAPVVRPLSGVKTDEPLFDAVATPNDSGTRHGRVLFAGVLGIWPDRTLLERVDGSGRRSAGVWQTAWPAALNCG